MITDADLKTIGNGGYVQNANGYDIRPYFDSLLTTAMPFELVFYDGVNGIVEMHAKVSTLDHVSDVIYYLAFGDSGISTDGSSTSTWDASLYQWVQHLPNGTSLSANDSTASGKNGTINGATAGAGQLDGAGVFNGSNQDIQVAGATVWTSDNLGSISAWFNATDASLTGEIVGYGDGTALDSFGLAPLLTMNLRSSHLGLTWAIDTNLNQLNIINGGTTLSNGTMYHGVITSTGSAYHIYLNGVEESQTIVQGANNGKWFSATGGVSSPVTAIGSTKFGGTQGVYFGGTIDEVRISNAVLSQDWITAEYNNQKSSSTFLTWGARTSTGYRVVFIRS